MDKKFITIFFKNDFDNLGDAIDFFKGLLGANIKANYNDKKLTVIYDANVDENLKDIATSLNVDLSIKSKMFISRVFSNNDELNDYIEMVNKINAFPFEEDYFDETDLIYYHIGNKELIRKHILGKYANDHEMIGVIKAFLDSDMNISKTATKVYMHRNTVINKIDKFIEYTGYDVKKFTTALVIYHIL